MKTVIAKHRADWQSQRDNIKPYYIKDGVVYDDKGKKLFDEKDFEEKEHLIYDRVTQCFISSGSMFCNALHKAGILPTQVDEVAYYQAVNENLRGKEDRFFWSAHERVIDILIGHSEYGFHVFNAKDFLEQIKESIDDGFPCLMSIWIKPYYPSGRGHIVVVSGYMEMNDGSIEGYFLDDPFGSVLSKYRDKNGDKVFIPMPEMRKLLSSPSNQPRKAGILVRKK